MSNEHYLIVSYFVVGGISIISGLTAFAWLRRPLGGLVRAVPNENLVCVLKKLFPAGLVLPALAGFLSVSYRSCGEGYQSIVSDRSYLVGKNQEQLSAICFFLMLAILAWGILLVLSLLTKPKRPRAPDS